MTLKNRRQFLQTSALVTASSLMTGTIMSDDQKENATGTTAAAADVPRARTNRDRIYIANKGGGIGKDREAMQRRLEEFKALGYTGIEGGSPEIKDVRGLRDLVEQTGVPVHGVVDGIHWKDRLSSPDEATRDRGRVALEQAIRDSYAIGGSTVLLVPGRVTGDDENHDHVWSRSIVEIRKVLPLAARLGIQVLIENVWNGFCEEAEQLRDYLDEIDSPWVGSYFDIGNVRKFGPPEEWIRVLGSRIVKLDVKDWGKANGFCRLSEGDVDWVAVRSALAEIQFTGWATREGGDKNHEDTVALMNELLDL